MMLFEIEKEVLRTSFSVEFIIFLA